MPAFGRLPGRIASAPDGKAVQAPAEGRVLGRHGTSDLTRHPFLDARHPIAFAHRGGASDAPENTLPAFARAVDLGYRYLETDVHATADGVLVAFHDEDLARTCGVNARIDGMEAAELDRVRVAGRERIPLFAELLEAFPDARINVDCKSDGALEPLSRMLRSAEVRERVCVGSFSDKRLRWLREEHGPSLCTSMGPREVGALRLGLPLPSGVFAAQIPPSQGPIPLVTPGLIDRAHRHGIAVHVWTIDDESQMGDLLDLGVDGIMTDRPTVLRDVLQRRDQWEDWACG